MIEGPGVVRGPADSRRRIGPGQPAAGVDDVAMHALQPFLLSLAIGCGAHVSAQATPPPCPPTPNGYEASRWQRAWDLHHAATVVDAHVGTLTRILDHEFDMGRRASDGHVDLPRTAEGGLDAAFYSVRVDARFGGDESALFGTPPPSLDADWPRPETAVAANGSARRALMAIDGMLRTVDRYPVRMPLCTSTGELRAAVRAGGHAALLSLEGGHVIEGDLGLLRLYHRLGVRHMRLAHTDHHEFADACTPATPRWRGLNRLGAKVVREMNRLGMIVDVGHLSDAACADALRVSKAPVIHRGCLRALCPDPRNVSDEMLQAIARNGGAIMLGCDGALLDAGHARERAARDAARRAGESAARARFAADSRELREALATLASRLPPLEPPPITALVAHVLRAVEVAGPDHVGLGSGFDDARCVPAGLVDATFLPRLTYELLAAGLPETTVVKVLGGNLLRVFEEVELVARKQFGEPPQLNDATDRAPLQR